MASRISNPKSARVNTGSHVVDMQVKCLISYDLSFCSTTARVLILLTEVQVMRRYTRRFDLSLGHMPLHIGGFELTKAAFLSRVLTKNSYSNPLTQL